MLLAFGAFASVVLAEPGNLEPNRRIVNVGFRSNFVGRSYDPTVTIVDNRPRQRPGSPRFFVRPAVPPVVAPPAVAPATAAPAAPAVTPVVASPAVAPATAAPAAPAVAG